MVMKNLITEEPCSHGSTSFHADQGKGHASSSAFWLINENTQTQKSKKHLPRDNIPYSSKNISACWQGGELPLSCCLFCKSNLKMYLLCTSSTKVISIWLSFSATVSVSFSLSHTRVWAHTRMYTHMYAHMHTCTQACMHTRTLMRPHEDIRGQCWLSSFILFHIISLKTGSLTEPETCSTGITGVFSHIHLLCMVLGIQTLDLMLARQAFYWLDWAILELLMLNFHLSH